MGRRMVGLMLVLSTLFMWSFIQAAPAGTIQQEQLEFGLVRVRRAAQLRGAGPSLAFLRNKSSGVGGTKVFNQANTVGAFGGLGSSASVSRNTCKNVYNRRYRRYFKICD